MSKNTNNILVTGVIFVEKCLNLYEWCLAIKKKPQTTASIKT